MSDDVLSVKQRINLLLEAIDGDERINEVLSKCKDSEAMISVLLEFSSFCTKGKPAVVLEVTSKELKTSSKKFCLQTTM